MMLLNISVCVLIFLVGFNLKKLFPDFTHSDNKTLNKLFFYHFFIAIAFHFYVDTFGGDAQHYWFEAKVIPFSEILELMSSGNATGYMFLFNYVPSNLLELSFFTGNMGYALVGYVGFIYLYRLCKLIETKEYSLSQLKFMRVSIFPWILFLPNLHFWSSGIGKDVVLFTSIIVFVYSLQHVKRRWIGILISMLLSFAVRPHITLFLIVAFGCAYLLDGKLKTYQKLLIVGVFIAGFIGLIDYVVQFVQLESLEVGVIEEFSSNKAKNLALATTGSAVDTSGYPFVFKIFTFLYRPLFFDINGVLAIVGSFENLFLLIFTGLVITNKPITGFKRGSTLIKGMLFFFLLGAISFSMILGNLGIMLRQKNMFIPLFLIFGLWVLYLNARSKFKTLKS